MKIATSRSGNFVHGIEQQLLNKYVQPEHQKINISRYCMSMGLVVQTLDPGLKFNLLSAECWVGFISACTGAVYLKTLLTHTRLWRDVSMFINKLLVLL